MELAAGQRKKLKALGHHLKVTSWIGQKGLTEAVINQINQDIEARELLKVRISGVDRDLRHQTAEQLGSVTNATLVQNLGSVYLFYRPSINKPLEKRIQI